ncbi:MAG: HAMP domain-containing protein [Boseongicola sp. SB0675_bin_26]|nr:HAMP domain-containing protein [Boseongicola sp. SB0675_bin_26]
MIARLLKYWMPRTFYGRSTLILLVPVTVIMVVVTVVFIQRLYEGVTEQMTVGVAHEIKLILGRIDVDSPDTDSAFEAALEVAKPLGIGISPGAVPPLTRRDWFDLSGKTVIATLDREIEQLLGVDLVGLHGFARLSVGTGAGPAELIVSRRRLNARNPHQFLVLIGFTALLMSAIALLYMRNQIRPIRRLARAAEAFGKGRVVPYEPSGATEVRLAGKAFLDMRGRIERQIEQRTLMLSGVSHDLRTPLTRMKLGLSLMDDSSEAEAMRRDVQDMEGMLEAFLSFARGDVLETPEQIDPLEFVRKLTNRIARSEPVVLGALEGEGRAMLRRAALQRALENLIVNAVRYGGQAKVSAQAANDRIRFVVEDSGPGIPEDLREFVLKPFIRLDSARNQDGGLGVGLGLSIAADVARQHGGTLLLGESADLGGLKAEISIPR